MKNPNGYGGIVYLGKNRRNPYAVRVTTNIELNFVDNKPKAIQKYKYLGYYPTRKEAMLELAKFNANPYNITDSDITFKEIFDRWFENRFADGVKTSAYNSYKAAFKKCEAIHNMKIRDIRTHHMQALMSEANSKSSCNNIIVVCNFVFSWAIKNDIVQKNYTEFVEIPKFEDSKKHKIFTTDEVNILWNNIHLPMVKLALMLIYSGLRIGEYLNLTSADVDVRNKVLNIRQAKTKAGIRIVPIADKTLKFWCEWQSRDDRYNLTKQWKDELNSIGLDNLFHDTRYTCVSMLTSAGVPQEIVKKIVGHSANNVTEKVYLHLELPTLLEAINKI